MPEKHGHFSSPPCGTGRIGELRPTTGFGALQTSADCGALNREVARVGEAACGKFICQPGDQCGLVLRGPRMGFFGGAVSGCGIKGSKRWVFRCGPGEGNCLTPKARGEWLGTRARKAICALRGRRLIGPCLLCVPSLGREQPRLFAAAARSARVSQLGRREEEEAAGAVLQGADVGVGAALPAAALLVRA